MNALSKLLTKSRKGSPELNEIAANSQVNHQLWPRKYIYNKTITIFGQACRPSQPVRFGPLVICCLPLISGALCAHAEHVS
jgi:hypothetical protein